MARPSEVRVLGHRLRTEPGVFHPLYFSSSRILAQHVVERAPRGLRVLDMGTGSGAVAIAAAGVGASVTACDINPSAVALARTNAALNGLTIDVVESDLFTALPSRVFDLIVFNIPFYPTVPSSHFEAAFRAGPTLETVRRFADGSREHLAQGGRVVIIFSEDCDRGAIDCAFEDAGLSFEEQRVTRRMFELFVVASFRLKEASSS
jgi:release factor glutamine methyltransferase